MATAKLTWTAADGSVTSYTLPVNFTWDYQELVQDETDRYRARDGTLRSYARPLKRRWVLKFQYISASQRNSWCCCQGSPNGRGLLSEQLLLLQDLHRGLDQRPGLPGSGPGIVVGQYGAGRGLKNLGKRGKG